MSAAATAAFAPVTVLFVRAPSPGQIYRFLERQCGRTPPQRAALNALGFLLSDAAMPDGLRALTGTGHGLRAFLESRGAQFTAAFPDAPVTLLYADDRGDTGQGEWGWRVWSAQKIEENRAGAAPESFSEAVARSGVSLGARLLAGLTGGVAVGDSALVRARAWARSGGRNLPIGRVPSATGKPLPVVDYVTVAALDQKGLLIEDSPRLYRLEWVVSGG